MKKYTSEQKEQIINLRKSGLKLKEIAKILEIKNLTTISIVCKEAGLKKKNYPEKNKYYFGQRFNNFILIDPGTKQTKFNNKVNCWTCLCDCGIKFITTIKQIKKGRKSCGCLSINGRYKKLSSMEVIRKRRFNHYKQGAARRNIIWNLDEKTFGNLLFANCTYCKQMPTTLVKSKNHQMMVNGVDRVNNLFEYNVDNCVSCCKFCNRAKGDATVNEFVNWINNLRNNYAGYNNF